MTKRKRNHAASADQDQKNRFGALSSRNVIFAVLCAIFCVMAVVFFGNKFMTTTEYCALKDTRVEVIASNGGGIPAQEPVLFVDSHDCPTIAFDETPEGYESLWQLKDSLSPGETYKFKVGFFRMELLGMESISWRGIGVTPQQ